MIYKNIKHEFNYILWLVERMKVLRFGIKNRIKTDSSTDFEMLARKLNHYEEEYGELIKELYSLLKHYDLQGKTDNFGKPHRALPLRGSG